MSDNYSIVCKRCGRKLTSEVSRNRGYGSYCYSKIGKDEKSDNIVDKTEKIKQIKGQLDIENLESTSQDIGEAKNMKIKFINVGRNNETWIAEYKEEYGDIEGWILGEASRHLASSNVGFYIDESGRGNIYAGFRTVGKLEILKEAM